MFHTILVAVDGSELSDRAVDFAANLAGKYAAGLIVLHVLPTLGSARVPPELRGLAHAEHVELTEIDVLKRAADQILQAALSRARDQGAIKVRASMGIGQIAQTIVGYAKDKGASRLACAGQKRPRIGTRPGAWAARPKTSCISPTAPA